MKRQRTHVNNGSGLLRNGKKKSLQYAPVGPGYFCTDLLSSVAVVKLVIFLFRARTCDGNFPSDHHRCKKINTIFNMCLSKSKRCTISSICKRGGRFCDSLCSVTISAQKYKIIIDSIKCVCFFFLSGTFLVKNTCFNNRNRRTRFLESRRSFGRQVI